MTKYERMSEVLKALAHPARLQIVSGLIKDECNVTQIQKKMGLPQSTISQHLNVLKNCKIIKGRRERTKVCYRVINKYAKEIVKMMNK